MTNKEKEYKYQFLNSVYFKPVWGRNDKGKSKIERKDCLITTYRDQVTNQKKLIIKKEPEISYYILKEDEDIAHHLNWISLDKVDQMICKYRDISHEIAKISNNEKQYFSLLKTDPSEAFRKFHRMDFVFGSDLSIEDYSKYKFLQKYKINTFKLHKSYFDIEVDTREYDEGFPKEDLAPCPVNVITFIDEPSMTSYTFILEDPKNQSYIDFKNNKDQFKKELKEEFPNFNFKFKFFDEEPDLIIAFFDLVNKLQPDFCSAWWIRFDFITLMNRLQMFGYSPEDVICHPDFGEYKTVYFHKDEKNQKNEDKTDYIITSSYTQYVDQMINYAQLRVGTQAKKESYKLGYIAEEELKDNKLDYSDEGDMGALIQLNFKKFIKYNIKDVILLYKLEEKLKDINMLYILSLKFYTRLSHTMRKTISIKNFAYGFYLSKGYVPGNNPNTQQGSSGNEELSGAFVSLPNLNAAMGMLINNIRSKYLYNNVIDFDLASLYPSILRAFNIDSSLQFGRLHLPDGTHAGLLMDHIISQDWVNISKHWLSLPGIEELFLLLHQAKE